MPGSRLTGQCRLRFVVVAVGSGLGVREGGVGEKSRGARFCNPLRYGHLPPPPPEIAEIPPTRFAFGQNRVTLSVSEGVSARLRGDIRRMARAGGLAPGLHQPHFVPSGGGGGEVAMLWTTGPPRHRPGGPDHTSHAHRLWESVPGGRDRNYCIRRSVR
jgi:hypothetical protein